MKTKLLIRILKEICRILTFTANKTCGIYFTTEQLKLDIQRLEEEIKMSKRNIDIDYLYEVYEDEYKDQNPTDKTGFIEEIETIIEDLIRQKEF